MGEFILSTPGDEGPGETLCARLGVRKGLFEAVLTTKPAGRWSEEYMVPKKAKGWPKEGAQTMKRVRPAVKPKPKTSIVHCQKGNKRQVAKSRGSDSGSYSCNALIAPASFLFSTRRACLHREDSVAAAVVIPKRFRRQEGAVRTFDTPMGMLTPVLSRDYI